MDNEKSPMAMMIQGILFEFKSKTLTMRTIKQLTAQIVKAVLMTREGLGLPEKGAATNFSDNEVKGELVDDKVAEKLAEKKAAEFMQAKKNEEEAARRKAAREAEANEKYKTRAIIAIPGTDPNDPDGVGPVAFKVPK